MSDTVLIDNYRGVEIYFDRDDEKFYPAIEDEFYAKARQSYSAAKNIVDEFVKENSQFLPFNVIYLDAWNKRQIVKIIGIRKDGRFVSENEKGNKKQISDYDEKDYFIEKKSKSELELLLKEINDLEDLIKPLKEKMQTASKKITALPTLKDVKKDYLPK